MLMTTLLIILGLIISLAGIVGCILPVIPGPFFSYIAILLLYFAKNGEPFSATFLIITGLATLVVFVLDYIVPVAGAKKYGASNKGIWGSIIGMVAGVFFFPPWGMILGTLLGAFAGEILAGKSAQSALRAGWGVFIGNLLGFGIKLAFCGSMLFFYISGMF
jgi:uncharacterized protein YqgC (DUF456 family)